MKSSVLLKITAYFFSFFLIFMPSLYSEEISTEENVEEQLVYSTYKEEGEEFLRKKQEESGIQSLDSGLLYRVIREGSGKKPTLSDTVEVHYEGRLINGDIFDSSYKRNSSTSFRLNRVIKGWQEGLQLMKEGSKYEFFIPSELAYGQQARPSIPANSVLIFTVELLKVKRWKEEGEEFLRKKKEESGIQSLDSGLLYRVIKEGSGKKPTLSDTVEVHYEGRLINGDIFDSSYRRNSSISFPLNGVIQGWQEGLQLMKEGSKYEFFIPSELAYGNQALPSIPANSVLIFTVELLKVKPR